MIKVIGGVTWQKAPSVQQYTNKTGDNWYVSGTQRLETPGTAGWRHIEKAVYLQEDGSWGKGVYYFPSKEAADAVLKKALGEASEPSPTSAFAAALQKARRR
ncbi:hypothetical protein HY412_01725 [Candidatus Kaiserbacteria bacterium]|nr:hypothetical protein [Candidatus Kaiserbacteria bacterium]